jgi:uncharacterized membrane protein
VTPAIKIYRKGDIYLCLLASSGLAVHAYVSSAGLWTAEPLFRVIAASLGISLLVLPGYSLSRLVGLDRYGTATLAGLAIALSLGILAASGAVIWVSSQSFSLPLFEAAVAGLTAVLSVFTLWRRSQPSPEDKEIVTRWQALGLAIIPLGIAVVALNGPLPASPATYYTEFYLVQTEPGVIVTIGNAEQQTETYYIAAESGNSRVLSGPIEVRSGAGWQGSLTTPAHTAGPLRLVLYRAGDNAPYRTLWVR